MHHTYLRHTSIWELPARRDYSALLKKVLSIRDVIVHRQGSVEQAIACVQSWQKESRVAHAYDYFRYRAQKVIWAQIIWKPFIPPKSSFVLWLGQRGGLLTRERLDFLHIDQTCGFCGLEIETVRHLFFTCPMSRAIWQPVRAWTRMRREMNTLEAAVKWLRKEARGTTVPARVRRLSFACTTTSGYHGTVCFLMVYSLVRRRLCTGFRHKCIGFSIPCTLVSLFLVASSLCAIVY